MALNISPRTLSSVITDKFPSVPKKDKVYWVDKKVSIGGVPIPLPILSYSRPPSFEDNATKGYTTSSIWQYGGNIYQPVTAPDTTAGTWKLIPNAFTNLPGDVLGASARCVGGLTAMRTGFTGPAIQLTATVSASPVTTDINILVGGSLDTDAVRKVLATADTNTFVYVTTVYDQSGTGNDVVFAAKNSAARGFYILWDETLGGYCLGADAAYSGTLGQGLSFPIGLSLAENSVSAYFFGRGIGSCFGPNAGVVAEFGSSTNAFVLLAQDAAQGPTAVVWDGAGGAYPAVTDTAWAPIDCRPCVVSMVGATGSVTVAVNENSFTKAKTVSATARTGGMLGAWDLNNNGHFSVMRFVGFAIGNATVTAAQDRSIRNWFYTKFDVKPQARDRVFYISDSRGGQVHSTASNTQGQAGNGIPLLLTEYLKSDCEVIGATTSGFTNAMVGANSDSPPSILPGILKQYRSGVGNVAAFLLGVNDFIVSGLTPAQSVAALALNVSRAKAVGFKTIVIAELATTSVTGNASTNLPLLRTLINNGESGADRILDVSNMSPVTTPSNVVLYPDGLHQSEVVSRLIASQLAQVVDELLAP